MAEGGISRERTTASDERRRGSGIGDGQHSGEWIGKMEQRQGKTRWEDDPTRRRDRQCRLIGQEADSTWEGSITEGWEDNGDGNNRFVTISDR